MPSLEELLARSRNELLDLSTRNRLLAIPVASKSARIVTVEDERADQVYRLLVAEKRSLGFRPGRPARPSAKPRPGNDTPATSSANAPSRVRVTSARALASVTSSSV